MSKGAAGFVLGSVFGAAVGAVAGIMLAPRSGAESRAMAADAMNDAWDAAADAYEKGGSVVSDRISGLRPTVDATTDELRAKIDLARERMEQHAVRQRRRCRGHRDEHRHRRGRQGWRRRSAGACHRGR